MYFLLIAVDFLRDGNQLTATASKQSRSSY